MSAQLPPHRRFIVIPMHVGERVVSLGHGAAGTIRCRVVDQEAIEDVYVIGTDDGRPLVVPEGDLRLVS
jgi:hypothetical protein